MMGKDSVPLRCSNLLLGVPAAKGFFIEQKHSIILCVTIHSTYVSSDLLAPPRNDKLRAYILKILEELQASSANTRIGLTLSDVYFT